MAVSATTLSVQKFDQGRGPVGLGPIGEACNVSAMARSGPLRGPPCQIPERPSANFWALFIIIIGAIIVTLCCYLTIQDRQPYRRIGYYQKEGDRNWSRLGRRRIQ